jgi:hypothetical protein
VTAQAPHEAPNAPRDHLRAFVALRDVPCPSCNYNLRDLTGSLCPECGQHLELRVGLTEPRLGLWIAGLIGLAAGAGFNALLLIYIGLVIFRHGRMRGIPGAFTVINSTGLIVMGSCLCAWLLFRGRIRRLSVKSRVGLAAAAWFLAILDVAVFEDYIR